MKLAEQEEELNEYLSKLTCRGCYNHCPLSNPCCGKSRIWINEAIQKLKGE